MLDGASAKASSEKARPAKAHAEKMPAPAPARLAAWSAALAKETQERPLRTVSLTLGTGFMLGGGLFSPLAGRFLGLGLRLGMRLLVPVLAEQLGSLTLEAFSRSGDGKRRKTHEAQ